MSNPILERFFNSYRLWSKRKGVERGRNDIQSTGNFCRIVIEKSKVMAKSNAGVKGNDNHHLWKVSLICSCCLERVRYSLPKAWTQKVVSGESNRILVYGISRLTPRGQFLPIRGYCEARDRKPLYCTWFSARENNSHVVCFRNCSLTSKYRVHLHLSRHTIPSMRSRSADYYSQHSSKCRDPTTQISMPYAPHELTIPFAALFAVLSREDKCKIGQQAIVAVNPFVHIRVT